MNDLKNTPTYILEYFASMQIFGEPYRKELVRRMNEKKNA